MIFHIIAAILVVVFLVASGACMWQGEHSKYGPEFHFAMAFLLIAAAVTFGVIAAPPG